MWLWRQPEVLLKVRSWEPKQVAQLEPLPGQSHWERSLVTQPPSSECRWEAGLPVRLQATRQLAQSVAPWREG